MAESLSRMRNLRQHLIGRQAPGRLWRPGPSHRDQPGCPPPPPPGRVSSAQTSWVSQADDLLLEPGPLCLYDLALFIGRGLAVPSHCLLAACPLVQCVGQVMSHLGSEVRSRTRGGDLEGTVMLDQSYLPTGVIAHRDLMSAVTEDACAHCLSPFAPRAKSRQRCNPESPGLPPPLNATLLSQTSQSAK